MIEAIAVLRIELAYTDPPIWRRVEVPTNASLKIVHDVIQATMGWLDDHLWEFRIGNRCYGEPDSEWPTDNLFWARSIKLQALIDRGVTELPYTYDFGDNWKHVVSIEAVTPAEPGVVYPRYVSGERRGPPEDVGSVEGFYEFAEQIADPRHPQHEEAVAWYVDRYRQPFDPDAIDVTGIELRLADIAAKRGPPAPKALTVD